MRFSRARQSHSLPFVAVLLGSFAVATAAEPEELFEKQIRPVLAEVCFRCHNENKASAGLRVDTREALLKGGDSGPALVPGAPSESLLLRAVQRADDVSAMPPDEPLRAEAVSAVSEWIAAGAPWPKTVTRIEGVSHWAFQPVSAVPFPAVRDSAWIQTSVDLFIRAAQEAVGVQPSPAADRRTLLRRLSYDLTGLPPHHADVVAYENDRSATATATVVERLLHSPRYGEHWGRHWLDVVRYADTAGENTDHPLPHAWRYRNWVIQAFNQNLPYDRFLQMQLAGDLLAGQAPPEQYGDHVVATGYLAIARRFGHDIDQDMHLTIEDTIDTLGKSMLGLTIGCARCHDHKYDPLTAADYYGLYGILQSTRFSFPGCEPKQQPRDLVPMLSPAEFAQRVQPVQQRIAELEASSARMSEARLPSARQLAEKTRGTTTRLSSGDVPDAGEALLDSAAGKTLERIAVRKGDVLQLAIAPRGNHGADSTRVELHIAETKPDGRVWSVSDLVDGLQPGNLQPDRYGHAAVWCFLDAHDGFALLPESFQKLDGHAELKGCRNGDTPSILVNTSAEPLQVWTRLDAKSFFMHPGPKGPVALAWLSPVDGEIAISGRLSDAHPGGDGVSWTLEHFANPGAGETLASDYLRQADDLVALSAAREQAQALTNSLQVPVAFGVSEGEAGDARIHVRGDPQDLGDVVPRRFPTVLGGHRLDDGKSSGRLQLAQWITSPDNPLTARVMVNRVWQWHFGRGLVATPNDFGTRGAVPSHPELLDHLARRFVDSGWDVRELHRQIVLSATYQQASPTDKSAAVVSGGRELYHAFARRRLTAEELRDSLLQVADEMDSDAAQAHPFPPEKGWSFTQHNPFAEEYSTFKRSVFVMHKRNRRTPFFALFDGADPNASTPLRDVTTVPTQALYFMNDPGVHERSATIARRCLGSSEEEPSRIDFAYRLLFGRAPAEHESREASEFLRDYCLTANPQQPDSALLAAWSALARVMLSSNEFLYVD